MDDFHLTGYVNNQELKILEIDDLKQFLKDKEGHRFTLNLNIQDTLNKSLLAYYWHVVIPKMMKGYNELGNAYFNKRKVDTECRKLIGIYHEYPNEDLTGYRSRLKTVSEMTNEEFGLYITCLQITAIEFMGIYIEDANEY